MNANPKPNARKGRRKSPEQIGRDAYLVRLLEDAWGLAHSLRTDEALKLINRTIWELNQRENKGDWAAQP